MAALINESEKVQSAEKHMRLEQESKLSTPAGQFKAVEEHNALLQDTPQKNVREIERLGVNS